MRPTRLFETSYHADALSEGRRRRAQPKGLGARRVRHLLRAFSIAFLVEGGRGRCRRSSCPHAPAPVPCPSAAAGRPRRIEAQAVRVWEGAEGATRTHPQKALVTRRHHRRARRPCLWGPPSPCGTPVHGTDLRAASAGVRLRRRDPHQPVHPIEHGTPRKLWPTETARRTTQVAGGRGRWPECAPWAVRRRASERHRGPVLSQEGGGGRCCTAPAQRPIVSQRPCAPENPPPPGELRPRGKNSRFRQQSGIFRVKYGSF